VRGWGVPGLRETKGWEELRVWMEIGARECSLQRELLCLPASPLGLLVRALSYIPSSGSSFPPLVTASGGLFHCLIWEK
jgi:hypothetical protein